MKHKIIFFLLGLLGVTACEEKPVMYGTPTSAFTIKGRVTDASGTPVNGIRITPVAVWHQYPPSDNFIPDEPIRRDSLYAQPTYTSPTGEYELRSDCFGWSNFNVTLRIEDLDGAENGGQFVAKEFDVAFTDNDQTESGSWTDSYKKEAADIVLDQVKNK